MTQTLPTDKDTATKTKLTYDFYAQYYAPTGVNGSEGLVEVSVPFSIAYK